MYKKIILLSALSCIFSQYAADVTPWLEIKPSYFFFATSPMKDIYGKGGFEIQASASVPVYCCIDVYGSLGYRKVWGNATNTGEKTTLAVVPFDIGIKPVFAFCERYFYFFALGPRFYHFSQHNDSPYVDPKVSGGGVGLFINTGVNMLLEDHWLIGIFGEYSYEKKNIATQRQNVFSNGPAQIGGFVIGASAGYAF